MGQRRDTLLAKPEFDAACQEFHDYYLEHLKYDFSVALREKGIVVPLPPQSVLLLLRQPTQHQHEQHPADGVLP